MNKHDELIERLNDTDKHQCLYYPEQTSALCVRAADLLEAYTTALERLVLAAEAAREDLLIRGTTGRGGERVVNMSATQWDSLCDSIEYAQTTIEQEKGCE